MNEYIAIYKCRLCGETVEGCHTGEQLARECVVDIAVDGKSKVPQAPNLIDIHQCNNGGLGIGDFQGFIKVGE